MIDATIWAMQVTTSTITMLDWMLEQLVIQNIDVRFERITKNLITIVLSLVIVSSLAYINRPR